MTFVDNFSPFVWHVHILGGDYGPRWYGLAYLFGFIMMYIFYRRAAMRGDIPGLKLEDVDILAIRIVAGVMIGGRLGFVIQQPGKVLHDPLFPFKIWEGGMAYFGGLSGVLLACWTFARRYGLSFLALTDLLSLPTCIALAAGRVANFINQELCGKPTDSKWGVIFPSLHDNTLRHPSQLYECASHLLLFAILWFIYNRYQKHVKPGLTSFVYLIGYGLFRLITDFWRQDEVYWGFLSDGQWVSLAVATGGAISLYIWWKKGRVTKESG